MLNHQDIDLRLLAMVRLCVEKIDSDPRLLAQVAINAARISDPRIREQWRGVLDTPWLEFRKRLLAETEAGAQIRQDAPFGGLLSNAERLQFFRPAERSS